MQECPDSTPISRKALQPQLQLARNISNIIVLRFKFKTLMIATAVPGLRQSPMCTKPETCVQALQNYTPMHKQRRCNAVQEKLKLQQASDPDLQTHPKDTSKGQDFQAVRVCTSKRRSHHHRIRSAIYPGQLCSDWDRH